MSVLIKGMEMPKSCGDCNFYYVDYEEGTASCLATSCYVQPHHYHKDNRDPGCPLVEVLTPHGRLIDADNVSSDAMCSHCVEEYCRNNCECFIENVQTILSNELITPTIIEAEVSE